MLWGLLNQDKSKNKSGIISSRNIDNNAVNLDSSDIFYSFSAGNTVASLLGNGNKNARERWAIYNKWTEMEANPLIGRALRIHVMGALSGDSATGKAISIQLKPEYKDQEKYKKILDGMSHLVDVFNEIDSSVAYNAIAFGDAYGRIYANKNSGVISVNVDELVRPSLIQPYEKMGRNVGYVMFSGDKPIDKLTPLQMARCKMPRLTWIPQPSVIEKNYRAKISEDDPEKQPILPSMVGGSILYNAEESYDNFNTALIGMTAQRWQDSIDEQIIGLNMSDMTKDQQERFKKSIVDMLKRSKSYAEEAVKNNKPILERIRHIIPTSGEKQITQISGGMSQGRASIEIDDVMFHAKTLSGNIGIDLSMLGFSDLLSGGLGDGGSFRNSVQMAELSGMVRSSITDFFMHIIDVHTYYKEGLVFDKKENPFVIKIVGSISALEKEAEATRFDKMSSGSVMVSTLQQMKDVGFDETSAETFLINEMAVSEEDAKMYAKAVTAQPQEGSEGGF